MKCHNCGKEVKENWKVCPWCKASLEKAIKKCPNCGEEVDDSWDVCPACEYPLHVSDNAGMSGLGEASSILPSLDDILPSDSDLDLVAGDIAEAKQREQEQANAAYQKKLSLARIACIRENFGQANGIYEELIADNPEDINAYIGFVRIESQNYTQYQGASIEKAIRVVEQIAVGVKGNLDREYQSYIDKRKAELARLAAVKEAERRAKAEAERKAREEAERIARAEAERKAKEDAGNFDIKNGVLVKYTGKGGDVTIPNNVTSIGNRAFSKCERLTSITIPNSVTSIGYSAFYKCSALTSITIPNSVTSIGTEAFSNCKKLTSITIPNSVKSISKWAFWGCSALTSITIPNGVTSIKEYTFTLCECLTSITIPNSVTSIGDFAFSSCEKLTSITIPNSVTSIGDFAFSSCKKLTSITIPNSVTSIGVWAFRDCSLRTVSVSKNCNVASNAFESTCKVTYR